MYRVRIQSTTKQWEQLLGVIQCEGVEYRVGMRKEKWLLGQAAYNKCEKSQGLGALRHRPMVYWQRPLIEWQSAFKGGQRGGMALDQ